MKIFVIGSKGFIGQNVCKYFFEKGYNVWGADVVVDYVNTKNYFLIDASNSDFNSAFQETRYDVCINCSGAASVPESIINPARDYFLNTVNVFKILEAIRKYQPECRFVNLSSAAVYGNPEKLPIKESEELRPISPYGVHKLHAEQICKEYYETFNIKSCCLRIFSAYGAGLKKQLFWDLHQKSKAGTPLVLFGTGYESRDFIYISDIVRAIDLIINNCSFRSDIINVANGEEIFIKDAVSTFLGLFNTSIQYRFSGQVRKGDPVKWKADIQKLTSMGYYPLIDIKKGLQEYFDWIISKNV